VIYSNGESSSGKRTDKSTTIRLVVIRRHEIVKEDTGGNKPISRDRGSAERQGGTCSWKLGGGWRESCEWV
jgi:hypothetical protein